MSATTWTFGTGGGGSYRLAPAKRAHLMLAAPVSANCSAFPAAVTVAARAGVAARPVLLVELSEGRGRRPGPFSTAVSRGIADLVKARFRDLDPVTRGQLCCLNLRAEVESATSVIAELPSILPERALCLVVAEPTDFRRLVEAEPVDVDSALLVGEFPRDRAVMALACKDLTRRGIRCRAWKLPLTGLRTRLSALGLPPHGLPAATAARLLAGLEPGPP